MTQEEKQLLTVDVCVRLLYGVKVFDEDALNSYKVVLYDPAKGEIAIRHLENSELRPILFPLSCLTREITVNGKVFVPLIEIAKMLYPELSGWAIVDGKAFTRDNGFPCYITPDQILCATYDIFDRLNEWMIDYRGLIEKGLAVSVFSLSENPYK